jgi:hypothetical protein
VFGTYHSDDVIVLLKDITGLITPLGTQEREKLIQSGIHYSEMLALEYEPTPKYMEIYKLALNRYSNITAQAVERVAQQIWNDKGESTALVSLARAGTPIGILIKRYIEQKYNVKISHYTISIIRGKGIDKNALNYILSRHSADAIQFVDGWTGKGAIKSVLNEALKDYPQIKSDLAVLSDPAYAAEKCGTHDDFLIASSCLNSTVSGLLSRTFLRTDIIGKDDFHGAVFYENLKDKDVTYEFIDEVVSHFTFQIDYKSEPISLDMRGLNEAETIRKAFGINSINYVKPSIGETTRVLLRRVPWKILVYSLDDNENLGHIYQLAKEKNVEVNKYPLKNYKACGLIKEMADI